MSFTDLNASVFESHRGLLQGIAYRMLGSVSDAEDMVEETWLRWSRMDTKTVESPRSWLVTVVSRLCLDRLKSAQVQREHYYGTWLPEPFLEQTAGPSADQVDESVSVALLLVLEKLSPVERAGFLLHEVFGYSFEEIATILDKPAVTCRKLVSRARIRVRSEKPRFTVTNREHEELLMRFLDACRAGKLEPLMELLGDSVALYSDSGGKAAAAARVLIGREEIARFLTNLRRTRQAMLEGVRTTFFNGVPGALFFEEGHVGTALCLEIRDGKIAAIFAHRNPDKLQNFEPPSNS
jgi:RNA polymerase sigma-70 factor (ECF subfamily)